MGILHQIARERKKDFGIIEDVLESVRRSIENGDFSRPKHLPMSERLIGAKSPITIEERSPISVYGFNLSRHSPVEFGIIGELKAASPSRGNIIKTAINPEYLRKAGDKIGEKADGKLLRQVLGRLTNRVNEYRASGPKGMEELRGFGKSLFSILGGSHYPLIPSILDITERIIDLIEGGALGISVLTESERFGGSFGNLLFTALFTPPDIPLLMKDFVVDPIQAELGSLLGASNALIIVKLGFSDAILERFAELGIEPLIEIHDGEDLDKIKDLERTGYRFVLGINNRDLTNLTVDPTNSFKLIDEVRAVFSEKIPVITESGILSASDAYRMKIHGIHNGLVGTALMGSSRGIKTAVMTLRVFPRPFIKICGITKDTPIDKIHDPSEIISAFGVVVEVPHSKRNVDLEDASEIFNLIDKHIGNRLKVLVSVNKNVRRISELDSILKPDLIQNHVTDLNDAIAIVKKLPPRLRRKYILPINPETNAGKGTQPGFTAVLKEIPGDIFGILIDSSMGSGKDADFSTVMAILQSISNRRILIAGGIGPGNILRYLEDFYGPVYRNRGIQMGFDASSGLENNGQKDPDLISEYIGKISKFLNMSGYPVVNSID